MRGPDSDPLGPEIVGALMAVDATLAGEPADPEYAELAELALILRRERPSPSDAFAARLDQRVERRFARPAPAARGTGLRRLVRERKRFLLAPAAGLGAAVAGVALVIVLTGGHGNVVTNSGGGASSSSSAAAASATVAGASSSSAAGGVGTSVAPDAKRVPQTLAAPHAPASGAASSSAAASSAASSSPGSVIPTPVIPGKRQVVQSAQLVLGVSPSRIDDVSQEVFNVVGREKGYVNGSNVTSGGDRGAYFKLSVPSANLSQTLTDLSQLRGAHVVSRTDNTNDITGQVGGAGEQLAEARALRRSLLKQLANATTTAQVDSIQARIHDANASIASDLSTLRGLQRQVAYSNITVNVQVSGAPAPVAHHSSGFTIGKAAHDAGRVLLVVAGVALIVLAVLVPLGLVAALVAWVAFAVRRRRREHALDLV
jgi:hypothetical protein